MTDETGPPDWSTGIAIDASARTSEFDEAAERFKDAFYKLHHLFQRFDNWPASEIAVGREDVIDGHDRSVEIACERLIDIVRARPVDHVV